MANSAAATVINRLGMPILATVASFLGLLMLDRLHSIDTSVQMANTQVNSKIDAVATQVNSKIDEVRKDQHDIALSIWNDLKNLDKNFQDDKVQVHTDLATEDARIRTLEARGDGRH